MRRPFGAILTLLLLAALALSPGADLSLFLGGSGDLLAAARPPTAPVNLRSKSSLRGLPSSTMAVTMWDVLPLTGWLSLRWSSPSFELTGNTLEAKGVDHAGTYSGNIVATQSNTS